MDLRAQRIIDSRYVDNESNDSGLSSETSQNSKERPTNIFDTRNLSSIRAVHFALDNHRKMTSQRSHSVVTNERKPQKFSLISSNKESKEPINLRSKNNPQISPFMVKINPKSSPCCEYFMEDIKQLQLPISDNIEIGCEYSEYHKDLTNQTLAGMIDNSNQFDEQDILCNSPCFEDKFSHIQIYQKESYSSQPEFHSYSISTSNQTDEPDTEPSFHSNYQSESCIHSIIQSLDQSKDVLSSFRLVMSTRDTGFRLKTTNQSENSFSGLIIFDILRAENLQPTSILPVSSTLKLLQCMVKMNSDVRIETSSEIFADKVIWDERFFIDLRESNFISILIYQSVEGCNKRLSYYGGLNLLEIINEFQIQSQLWDQIILQLEPRGLLYIQLGLIYLHQSLSKQFCYHLTKNTQQNSLHSPRYSNFVTSISDWIYILRWCIAAAEDKQRLMTINIYKTNVSENKIIHLLKHIMNIRQHGNQIQIDINIHTVTSLILLCLREMPEPLIPHDFSQKLMVIIEHFFNIYDPNGQHLACEALALLRTLPNQNQMAVLELFQHLHLVHQHGAINKLTCHYISLLFAPLIFHFQNSLKYQDHLISSQILLMKSLLENWSILQDMKPLKMPIHFKSEKYPQKSMISIAIQTDENQKSRSTNLSDSDNFEESNSSKTMAYKSILKKPQNIFKKSDTSLNNDYNRTTFI